MRNLNKAENKTYLSRKRGGLFMAMICGALMGGVAVPHCAVAQSSFDGASSFLDESDFESKRPQMIEAEDVVLPNLLELKTDQEQATSDFNVMLQTIVSEVDNVEDLAYEKPVMKSLFYNLMEYALIQEARRGFEARIPGSGQSANFGASREIRARRNLVLGGIVYSAKDSWSIYLNELRITPNSLPDEILDIQVHNDFVRIKWFDKGTNTIFPVKLRPNQSFNLDARLFFPG
jgi:hypothetical protein